MYFGMYEAVPFVIGVKYHKCTGVGSVMSLSIH